MCLTNYALRHEGVWESGCIDPHFLDLVSFTTRPLYSRGKRPQYPLVDLRAGLDDLRKFLTLPGLNPEPSVVQPVASRYTTSLSRREKS
jgi:hypothetical protein